MNVNTKRLNEKIESINHILKDIYNSKLEISAKNNRKSLTLDNTQISYGTNKSIYIFLCGFEECLKIVKNGE